MATHQPLALAGAVAAAALALRLSRSDALYRAVGFKIVLSAFAGGLIGQLAGIVLSVGSPVAGERIIGAPLATAATLGSVAAFYTGAAILRAYRARRHRAPGAA